MKDYLIRFEEYLKNKKTNSENTFSSYMRDVSFFADFLASKGFKSFGEADEKIISEYVAYLKSKGKSATTISRSVSSIRCLYRFLVQSGEVQLNPTRSVKLEKTNKKPPQVLSGDEISRLLAVQDLTEPRGCRDKAMLELLYSTGIKVSEIIELNVNDINLRTGVLYCGNNKNLRAVPVCTSALVSVSDYIYRMRSLMIDTDDNQALFVNLNGSRLTRQGFWKIIKGYAKSAKIEKELTPQILRNSFALHLLESGKNVKDIQVIMGHADISSTQVYLKLLDNDEKKVYN
ncbi:MAG: site-specific tyrosine recombinase XerD [Ruminococcaceae bacterium]|nr:site-specific tyrosine recombinase XerD [Oscillospiraceae bacterium]